MTSTLTMMTSDQLRGLKPVSHSWHVVQDQIFIVLGNSLYRYTRLILREGPWMASDVIHGKLADQVFVFSCRSVRKIAGRLSSLFYFSVGVACMHDNSTLPCTH